MKRMMLPGYNYIFDDKTGFFARWGKTLEDDPQFSPIGNEILDIQISDICHVGCKFCYQNNVSKGKNMTFETFKSIIDKMRFNLCQIALATGDVDANPDIWKMMEYARSKSIVPNITISGYRLTDEIVDNLVRYCGAVAVSHYSDDVCFDAVKRLNDAGLEQVNIHQLASKETKDSCLSVMKSFKTDERLKNLNAIVFLSLKQKGRGIHYNRLTDEEFSELVNFALNNKIPIGADACSSHKFIEAIEGNPDFDKISQMIEPCESGCFSAFVNVDGIFSPCSFLDGVVEGIDLSGTNDYINDVWFGDTVKEWRKRLLENNRVCPVYEI